MPNESMKSDRPREIEWTAEQVRSFWDYHGSNEARTAQYFGAQMGRSLLDYVAKRINIGTAIDVGCGRGHLLQYLMQRGHDVYGSDQSPASIDLICSQLTGAPHFKGASVGTQGLPDGVADTLFMMEVVEHLNDEALDRALNEAHRLLKRGGHLVLTTPNQEDLDATKIMCPNCMTVFHQMQHVRSWSADTLAARVAAHGFRCRSSEGEALTPYSGLLNAAYRRLYLMRHKGARPSLIYIGTKV